MARFDRIFAVVAALIAAASGAAADHYKVSFSTARADDDGALRLARVEARLTPDGGRFRLTRASEDSGLYHGWAGFITKVEAQDTRGRPVALIYEAPGVWRLDGVSSGEVTVRYSINLQHDRFPNEPGDDELASAHSYGVMWTGRALFMEGAPSNRVAVEFELPPGWKVSAPWRAGSGAGRVFRPQDTDDLLDAAFMAGTHRQWTVDLGETQARIALGPPVQRFGPVFERLIRDYFGAYTELFGASPGDDFLLIGAEASFLGGGVMGRTISLSLKADGAGNPVQAVVAYVIAHEGFHLWNVQWGGRKGSWGEVEWLKEGIAEYYAFLTGLRLRKMDDPTFLNFISERHRAYLSALDSGKTLVTAAASKNASQQSYDLIYSGGMMVCILLDLRIRSGTQGGKSLDDVVRAIHRRFSDGRDTLTLAALTRVVREETGVDVSGVLRDIVRRGQRPDMMDAFAYVGLRAQIGSSDEGVAVTISQADAPTPEQQKHYRSWTAGK